MESLRIFLWEVVTDPVLTDGGREGVIFFLKANNFLCMIFEGSFLTGRQGFRKKIYGLSTGNH